MDERAVQATAHHKYKAGGRFVSCPVLTLLLALVSLKGAHHGCASAPAMLATHRLGHRLPAPHSLLLAGRSARLCATQMKLKIFMMPTLPEQVACQGKAG